MNQTFIYRKHLRLPFRYLMLIEMSIFLGIVFLVLGFLVTEEQEIDVTDFLALGIVVTGISLFMLIEMVLMYHLFLKRFRSISVTLTEDTLVYTNAKGQISISYEDIQKLEFPSIKYTGGWMKIIYGGGAIRLTVVLEHIGDFVHGLKEKLQEKNMEHVYNEKNMFSFYKTAVFSDESWDRVYHNFKVMLTVHILCIIITKIILLSFGYVGNTGLFLYGSLFAPLLGYLVSEIIIGRQVKKRVNKEELKIQPRNPESEYRIFTLYFFRFTIGYLLLVIAIMLYRKL